MSRAMYGIEPRNTVVFERVTVLNFGVRQNMRNLPIKLQLPNDFLKDEVRDGYDVSEKHKKIWAIELDLLWELLRVCQKHDIKCSLAFGSLIGAVRHKGFIPWDDDFDVMFERTEYEKLLSVGPNEFKHPYFLQYALSDRKKFCPLARLRNSLTTGYVTGDPVEGYNSGIYLDLYVFDANPRMRLFYILKYFLKRIAVKCMNFYYEDKPRKKGVTERIVRLARPLVRMISYERCWRIYSYIMSLHNRSESRRCHMLTAKFNGQKTWIDKDDMFDIVWVPFEFVEVPVVRNYHELLTRSYGDYMAFPPASERGKWHGGTIHYEPDIPYEQYLGSRK